MQIQPSTRNSRFIDTAISDDGRVSYSPIGNDRLIDLTTGRDMWLGLYPDADGFFTTQRVPADLWQTACALMTEADAHNARVHDEMREAAFARKNAREEAWGWLSADMDRADSTH